MGPSAAGWGGVAAGGAGRVKGHFTSRCVHGDTPPVQVGPLTSLGGGVSLSPFPGSGSMDPSPTHLLHSFRGKLGLDEDPLLSSEGLRPQEKFTTNPPRNVPGQVTLDKRRPNIHEWGIEGH